MNIFQTEYSSVIWDKIILWHKPSSSS